jgi:hypothetical protein
MHSAAAVHGAALALPHPAACGPKWAPIRGARQGVTLSAVSHMCPPSSAGYVGRVKWWSPAPRPYGRQP